MDVTSLAEETSDTLVPNGETWQIRRFLGSAAYLPDAVVSIIWDPDGTPEILDLTHGDKDADVGVDITGDGIKVLRISLLNDTNTTQILGAHWEGKKI